MQGYFSFVYELNILNFILRGILYASMHSKTQQDAFCLAIIKRYTGYFSCIYELNILNLYTTGYSLRVYEFKS